MLFITKLFVLCYILQVTTGVKFALTSASCKATDNVIQIKWTATPDISNYVMQQDYVPPKTTSNQTSNTAANIFPIESYIVTWFKKDLRDDILESDIVTQGSDDDSFRKFANANFDSFGDYNYEEFLRNNTVADSVRKRVLEADKTQYKMKRLDSLTTYSVAIRALVNSSVLTKYNLTYEYGKLLLECEAKTEEGVASPPRNLTIYARLRTAFRIRWADPLIPNGEITNYVLEYRYRYRRIKMVNISAPASYYLLKDLDPHHVFLIRMAAQNSKHVGNFTEWTTISLDIKTFEIEAVLPLEEKINFQRDLRRLLPTSYIGQTFINQTSMGVDTFIKVFYEIFFDSHVELPRDAIQNMFYTNRAREITSYTDDIIVHEISFCGTKLQNCDPEATCQNQFGSFRCKCNEGFVDTGVTSHYFPGRRCVPNTSPPSRFKLSVISPTTVHVVFGSPDNKVGTVEGYELQYQTLSGEISQTNYMEFGNWNFIMEEFVDGLRPNSLHQFRVRAMTDTSPGEWSDWKPVWTVCDVFKLTFNVNLTTTINNYQAARQLAHVNVSRVITSKLKNDRSLEITDFEIEKSDLTGRGNVKVEVVIYQKYKQFISALIRKLQLATTQRKVRRILLGENVGMGNIIDAINITDIHECGTSKEDCLGNPCENLIGSFQCKCPVGNIDVSPDYNMLAGRKCLIFDAPPSFKATLANPKTVALSWRIPPQMKKSELNYWFVVEYRVKNTEKITSKTVRTNGRNFTEEDFVMTKTIFNLQMNVDYEFRVAAANPDDIGRYTSWSHVKTSNSIFTAKLNLTTIVYKNELHNQNNVRTNDIINNIRDLIDKILKEKMPEYIGSGNIEFLPGIQDRTYAEVEMFFDTQSSIQSSQISQKFKFTNVFDEVLGLDFDHVQVKDYNECNTTYDDCSKNAKCLNLSPGYRCECKEGYVDLSQQKSLSPGRYCFDEDLITTPQPTTAPITDEQTSTASTTEALPLPDVTIHGEAIAPHKIRLTWQRMNSFGNHADLDYIFQYKVKGTKEWESITAASFLTNAVIEDLRSNLIYVIRVAERWKNRVEIHTVYSFPIEVRTTPFSFRIFLHLTTIPSAGLYSSDSVNIKSQLADIVSDYITNVFTHHETLLNFATIKFGSTGKITFLPHPDRGIIASAVFYVTDDSTTDPIIFTQAYISVHQNIENEWPISFNSINDLNECISTKLQDCSYAAQCTNTVGSYTCTCVLGYAEAGERYFLLEGRYCLPFTTSPTNSPVSTTTLMFGNTDPDITVSTTSIISSSSSMRVLTPTRTQQIEAKPTSKWPTTLKTTTAITPTPILLSQNCPPGQDLINNICKNILLFTGEIDILLISGKDVTVASIKDTGVEYVRTAAKAALDSAFKILLAFPQSGTAKIQDIKLSSPVQVLFAVVLEKSENEFERFKRNALSGKVTVSSLESKLTKHLDKQDPRGLIQDVNGQSVQFRTESIKLYDVNECKSRKLSDCDVLRGSCTNTEGSFECGCRTPFSDVSPDPFYRPGRKCSDSCNPNPCLYNGFCTPEEVGSSCICMDGYHGDICENEDLPEKSNTLIAALLSVAGAVFLIILCLVFGCCMKRRRTEKNQKNKDENELEIEQGYASSEFDETDTDEEPEEKQKSQEDEKVSVKKEETPKEQRPDKVRTTPDVVKEAKQQDLYVNHQIIEQTQQPTPPTRSTSISSSAPARHGSTTSQARPPMRLPRQSVTSSIHSIPENQRSGSSMSTYNQLQRAKHRPPSNRRHRSEDTDRDRSEMVSPIRRPYSTASYARHNSTDSSVMTSQTESARPFSGTPHGRHLSDISSAMTSSAFDHTTSRDYSERSRGYGGPSRGERNTSSALTSSAYDNSTSRHYSERSRDEDDDDTSFGSEFSDDDEFDDDSDDVN